MKLVQLSNWGKKYLKPNVIKSLIYSFQNWLEKHLKRGIFPRILSLRQHLTTKLQHLADSKQKKLELNHRPFKNYWRLKVGTYMTNLTLIWVKIAFHFVIYFEVMMIPTVYSTYFGLVHICTFISIAYVDNLVFISVFF